MYFVFRVWCIQNILALFYGFFFFPFSFILFVVQERMCIFFIFLIRLQCGILPMGNPWELLLMHTLQGQLYFMWKYTKNTLSKMCEMYRYSSLPSSVYMCVVYRWSNSCSVQWQWRIRVWAGVQVNLTWTQFISTWCSSVLILRG